MTCDRVGHIEHRDLSLSTEDQITYPICESLEHASWQSIAVWRRHGGPIPVRHKEPQPSANRIAYNASKASRLALQLGLNCLPSEDSCITKLLSLHAILLHSSSEELLQGVLPIAGCGLRVILFLLRVVHQHALCGIVLSYSAKLGRVLHAQRLHLSHTSSYCLGVR